MKVSRSGNFSVSQDLEILLPKSGRAYPVPCAEWQYLKKKLRKVSRPPWILPALTSLFLTASLTTLIAIVVGGVNAGQNERGLVVAWAVVATTGGIGLVCLAFSIKQHRMDKTQVSEVVEQMDLIEQRFEQEGAPAPIATTLGQIAQEVMKNIEGSSEGSLGHGGSGAGSNKEAGGVKYISRPTSFDFDHPREGSKPCSEGEAEETKSKT